MLQLQLNDLQLRLGNFNLGPLSLSLQSGSYFLLMGPSGCGKTTLLKIIAGAFGARHAGQIMLDDACINTLAPHRRRLAFVSQNTALFPHLSVRQNLLFGLAYQPGTKRDQAAAANAMAELLAITHLLDRDPATLSGGESKRVALARALVTKPRLLLLDEPLSMLDSEARETILDRLYHVHRETGTTTIHVTHHTDEAWRLQACCGIMREGQLVQTGDINTLWQQPADCFVARFLGGKNIFPANFPRHHNIASCQWGEIPLASPATGDHGFVQIHPNTLELVTTATTADACTITAPLRSIRNYGLFYELQVGNCDTPPLLVHLLDRDAQLPQPGQLVTLRLRTWAHPLPATDSLATPPGTQLPAPELAQQIAFRNAGLHV